VNKI
jgi:hypothetical protein